MFEIKIVRDEFHESFDYDEKGNLKLDSAGKPIEIKAPHYTFHVSDDEGKTWLPSLKWFRECTVEGLPKTYYIDRCINRLKLGASRTAFGDALPVMRDGQLVGFTGPSPSSPPCRAKVFQDDSPPKITMTESHGGVLKPKEERKKWKAIIDGKELPGEFPSEMAARAACAIHCFMTRGKLGNFEYIHARLKELVPEGKEFRVWACPECNEIRATVDGQEYKLGWNKETQELERVKAFTRI